MNNASARFEKVILRRKFHILMICANTLLNDARVLKTASSLRKGGYRVTLVGLQEKPLKASVEVVRGFNFEILRLKNPAWTLKKQGKWNKAEAKDYSKFCSLFAKSIQTLFDPRHFSAIYSHDMYGLSVGGVLHGCSGFKNLPWIHDIHEYVRGLTEVDQALYDFINTQEQSLIYEPVKLSTVSPVLAQRLSECYQRNDYEIVYNCPRLCDLDRSYRSILSDCPSEKGENCKLITYHGNVKPIRGVENLIHALAFLPKQYQAAIVCNVNNVYIDSLRRLALDIAPGRVYFLPYVPAHKVSSYIQGSTATIHTINAYPNSEVALPNKLFESLHAEVPFVCPDLEAMSGFVATHGCGVVARSNLPKDLADAIISLEDNYQGIKQTLKNKSIHLQFSWESCESVILERMVDPVLLAGSIAQESSASQEKNSAVMHVVHLPASSAGQPHVLAHSLAKNFSAKSASLSATNKYSYPCDISLSGLDLLKADKVGSRQREKLVQFFEINALLQRQDIFHFHARPLLYGKELDSIHVAKDLAFLKNMNKKVYFHFRGSEARLQSVFSAKNEFSWMHDISDCQDESGKEEMLRQSPFMFDENGQIEFIDRIRSYATEIFVTDGEVGSYVPNATIIPRSVRKELFKFGQARDYDFDHEKPLRIVHAPSRPFIKGTQYIVDAINKLVADGYEVELDLLTGCTNDEVLARCKTADLCIDQLRIGWYGVFSVEAMALGLPVICFIRDDLVHYLAGEDAVINANPSSIYDVLKRILDSPKLLAIYGQAAFNYASSVHHPDVVREILEQIYSDDWESPKNEEDNERFSAALSWLGYDDTRKTEIDEYVGRKERVVRMIDAISADLRRDYVVAIPLYGELVKKESNTSRLGLYSQSRIRYLQKKLKDAT